VPDIPLDTEVSGAQAIALLGDLFGHLFPNLAAV